MQQHGCVVDVADAGVAVAWEVAHLLQERAERLRGAIGQHGGRSAGEKGVLGWAVQGPLGTQEMGV